MKQHNLTKQKEKAVEASKILEARGLVYLAFSMRAQKTPTALFICQIMGYKSILIITKKGAINGVKYWSEYLNVPINVINYESLHKLDKTIKYDVLILDEAHTLGTIQPRNTNVKNKLLKLKQVEQIAKGLPIIYLSGTPYPESIVQIFSQFNISDHSPFSEKSFKAFAENYVIVKQVLRNGYYINDYRLGKTELINQKIEPLMVTMTLKEAGAKQYKHIESVVTVPISDNIKDIVKILLKDKIVKVNDKYIVCETAPSEKNKVLQICSGTAIADDGERLFLHVEKCKVIKEKYQNERIGVFYMFKAERDMLIKYFKDEITENSNDFQQGKKRIFITQITSGAEGIDLSNADRLVYFNLTYSGKSFMQSKARHSSLTREKPLLIDYLFSDLGFEAEVLKKIQKKENYTTEMFARFAKKMLY